MGTRGVPRAEREPQMLDVAGQVFARGGYHTASMDEIAELAGVSKPMLYAYFGSKEGLYVAYIDRTGRELLSRLNAAHGGLRGRIDEFLAFVEEHRDGWRVLFGELVASAPLADEVTVLRRQIALAIRQMIEAEDGGLSEPASDAIASAIVGAGESLANWWLEQPQVAREQVADWYAGLVQAAIEGVRDRRPATRSARRPAGSPAARPA